jgi:hypothetical protein
MLYSTPEQLRFPGVSHLLHTRRPSHLRAFLDKHGNVEGEVLDRLIALNVVLPGGGRSDAIVVFPDSIDFSGNGLSPSR